MLNTDENWNLQPFCILEMHSFHPSLRIWRIHVLPPVGWAPELFSKNLLGMTSHRPPTKPIMNRVISDKMIHCLKLDLVNMSKKFTSFLLVKSSILKCQYQMRVCYYFFHFFLHEISFFYLWLWRVIGHATTCCFAILIFWAELQALKKQMQDFLWTPFICLKTYSPKGTQMS